MPTMPQLQDTGADPNAEGAEAMAGAPPDDQQPAMPDGNDPAQMVGFIDPRLPAKVRVFLKAAKKGGFLDADRLKKILASSADHVTSLAQYIEKTIQMCETRLGPLTDEEHDKVAMFLAGWLASGLQAAGMPGLDKPEGRQDLIGRILHALDGMTQEQQGAPDAQGAPPPPGADAGAPPPPAPGGGTMPQLQGP